MYVDFNILNQLGSPSINSNTFANRPAAGQTGRLFVSTDTFEIYRDNGTTWDLIGGPGSSTITGSGTAGTIPLWTSTSEIGDSDLRQLSSQALILNSATDDWPIGQISNDPGRLLMTNDSNQPMLILWSKDAFGSGNDYGEVNLGAVTAIGSTTIGGGSIIGGIENNTDYSGYLDLLTTDASGVKQSALTFSSTQIATFKNNLIVNSPGKIGIQTATPGAALDVHSTGTIAQFNTTSGSGNTYISWQRAGAGLWRLGDTYNGGNNFFELHNTTLAIDALEFEAATNKSTFQATQTYTTGLARANYLDYNLSVAAGGSFSSPNAITALGASLDLSLAGNATIPSGARSGLDAYNSVSFTGTGTLTHTQGTQIRAYSNLTTGWAFSGSATGTITHLAGMRVLFPDNTGSAVSVTNNYALLINDQTANTGTVTYTNRFGIYQEGASDLNYMAANLLLGSTTNNGNRLQVTGNGYFTGVIYTDIVATATGTFIDFRTSAAQSIMYLDATNKRVGIGTTAPTQNLDISGTLEQFAIIQTTSSGGYGAGYRTKSESFEAGVSNDGNQFSLYDFTNSLRRLNMTTGGNILIGTTTDGGAKLTVNGATSINTTTNGSYSKLIVAGGIHCDNNTDASTLNQNGYGNFYGKRSTVIGGTGATTIKPTMGSESSIVVVNGIDFASNSRFGDVLLFLGAGTTAPVVMNSVTYLSPASRTYTNSGETLQLSLTGVATYLVFVTGMGSNEST